MNSVDPREAQAFRFVRRDYAAGEVRLVYAFDDGPELIECIGFPHAPDLPRERQAAFDAALDLLHWIAGVSYYKAGVPAQIRIESAELDAASVAFLDALYVHGLGEFGFHNKIDLRARIRFPAHSRHPGLRGDEGETSRESAGERGLALGLPRSTLVPIGGGKDSLVSVELLKHAGENATAVWIGSSGLIESCARRTGLPMLNIARSISPLLFDYNRAGAFNGHIPVTAINSAILVVAAILYGHDAIAFSNERSASSATLEYDGVPINHQWSKGWEFERSFADLVRTRVAADLHYYSLLRPLSELAVASRFARSNRYDDVFSSCNRNFRILGPKPSDRWCGQCPKCHFVFLALAPFMPKPRLLGIFGRNLLDDPAQVGGFDALIEYRDHKPFECVGEGRESRAAMAELASRAEWREDAIIERFAHEILPRLDAAELAIAPLLVVAGEQRIPPRLLALIGQD
ncbi:MAG: UDP-N-acetyl-alpha-D-muramoyl-L-alanyl-L-glutamate epimerase [Dokdonella sp.]|uniref:UDP-N-acetyl-alpha-D-muramoyl-L-alanyl-L- glutamate epimerase n=1 Tax=Dokdonella sp. TaxID=2291710 RepID=UPI002BEBB85E|nr:endonuclease domain-containing protein [Xanthomonadales bacterium]HQV71778.1 UDP-N-acetyl-alpha-D-muramoyl-L-alanyl-L-glutamate epimerase [Dokdonella sp.]MBL0222899.1 endonuclease domain-containing protein [Xanthomonadales bacterium]HQW76517.1 UDP-N-acetyl-alpha-D-muramoyl-L-alanyl-L-glutamate epimerase [Dokdonella sp.]HQY54262.1 UDP-N-acetyl-alpha-D-muramoyl-L-alanyl-L-glutamate epimerase [Dokdonella sp.]